MFDFHPRTPKLVLSAYAYLKWKFMCHAMNVEVSAFGLSKGSETQSDLMYIQDLIILKQSCTSVYTEMDEMAVANYCADLSENGYEIQQGMRVWFHTHPEMSANPSQQDEETFRHLTSNSDWYVMAIMSKLDMKYARYHVGAGTCKLSQEIPIEVDWSNFAVDLERVQKDYDEWKSQLKTNVSQKDYRDGLQFDDGGVGWQRALFSTLARGSGAAFVEDTEDYNLSDDPNVIFIDEDELEWTQRDYYQDFDSVAQRNGWYSDIGHKYCRSPQSKAKWKDVCDEFKAMHPEYVLAASLLKGMTWQDGTISETASV